MAAIDSHDDSDSRFSLLELDLPASAAPPAPRPAPAPTPASAPSATPLETGRASLLRCTSLDELALVAQGLRNVYPDEHPIRAALRPVLRSVQLAITWLRLWASLSRAVAERPALVTAIEAQPHAGTFARRSSSDAWGGFVPFDGRAVRPGDRLVLRRKNGSTQECYVGELLHSNYRVQGKAGTLVSFTMDRAPVAAPVAAPVIPTTQRQAIPVVRDMPAPVASDAGTIGGALGDIVEASTAQRVVSGSLADGTMAGVGFTSAAGYVQALANGTKRATADMYLSTLASKYGYTPAQLAALTVTIIVESTLPVGAGITHTPTGPDLFEQRRVAATVAAHEIRVTADAATVALAQRFTTTATDTLAWWEIGWDGSGSITRGEILAATGGRAPEPKAAETQLGRTCDSLRGTHDCALVTPPIGVRRRWQIGRGHQHAAFVGAEYGRVLAIVDLLPNGSLTWEGDAAICAEVRAEFERLCADEVLRPGDITSWLSAQLRYRYAARRNAHNYLVPPEHVAAASDLCTRIASVWGRTSWVYGSINPTTGKPEIGKYVTDVATILGGLLVAATDEVIAAEQAWAATVAAAEKKSEKVGARAAAHALVKHDGDKPSEGLLARVDGLRVLGDGPLASLRTRVAALRSQIVAAVEAANDDTSTRFANVELT